MCCANYNIYRVTRKYSVKYARTPQSLAERTQQLEFRNTSLKGRRTQSVNDITSTA